MRYKNFCISYFCMVHTWRRFIGICICQWIPKVLLREISHSFLNSNLQTESIEIRTWMKINDCKCFVIDIHVGVQCHQNHISDSNLFIYDCVWLYGCMWISEWHERFVPETTRVFFLDCSFGFIDLKFIFEKCLRVCSVYSTEHCTLVHTWCVLLYSRVLSFNKIWTA